MYPETSAPDTPSPDETGGLRRGPVLRADIIKVVEPAAAAHKCELVDLEWRREPTGWVMRLYVEHFGHDPRLRIGGVGIDECAKISRDVSTALDVADIIDHHYHLEVSSPGLERPLTKPEHYRRFAGLRAKVRLERPLRSDGVESALNGRKAFRGEILGGDDTAAQLRDDETGEVNIPFDQIQRAALVYEPAPKIKPGKGRAKGKGKGQVTTRDSRDGSEQER